MDDLGVLPLFLETQNVDHAPEIRGCLEDYFHDLFQVVRISGFMSHFSSIWKGNCSLLRGRKLTILANILLTGMILSVTSTVPRNKGPKREWTKCRAWKWDHNQNKISSNPTINFQDILVVFEGFRGGVRSGLFTGNQTMEIFHKPWSHGFPAIWPGCFGSLKGWNPRISSLSLLWVFFKLMQQVDCQELSEVTVAPG